MRVILKHSIAPSAYWVMDNHCDGCDLDRRTVCIMRWTQPCPSMPIALCKDCLLQWHELPDGAEFTVAVDGCAMH